MPTIAERIAAAQHDADHAHRRAAFFEDGGNLMMSRHWQAVEDDAIARIERLKAAQAAEPESMSALDRLKNFPFKPTPHPLISTDGIN